MFFTSEASIPFTSKEDVMKAYPNYVLQMMDGNDVFFQYRALQVRYENWKTRIIALNYIPKNELM